MPRVPDWGDPWETQERAERVDRRRDRREPRCVRRLRQGDVLGYWERVLAESWARLSRGEEPPRDLARLPGRRFGCEAQDLAYAILEGPEPAGPCSAAGTWRARWSSEDGTRLDLRGRTALFGGRGSRRWITACVRVDGWPVGVLRVYRWEGEAWILPAHRALWRYFEQAPLGDPGVWETWGADEAEVLRHLSLVEVARGDLWVPPSGEVWAVPRVAEAPFLGISGPKAGLLAQCNLARFILGL